MKGGEGHCKVQLEKGDKEEDHPFPERAPRIDPKVGYSVNTAKTVPSTVLLRAIYYSSKCVIHSYLNQLLVYRPLGCLQFFSIINNAEMDILVHLFFCNSLCGEGNGRPHQYSGLGNPMDRGAWWATVHAVAQVGHD